MGDEAEYAYYQFYLREKLTPERMREIFQAIVERNPSFTLSLGLEQLAELSYDINDYWRRHGGVDGPIGVISKDGFEVRVLNVDNPHHFENIEYTNPHIKRGERQLSIAFEPEDLYDVSSTFINRVFDNPRIGLEMLPLISTVASVSKAFLGIYGEEHHFEIRDPSKIWLRDIEYQQEILTQRGGEWGSFYFDDRLARDIGLDVLAEFASTMLRSDDGGCLVERFDIPLIGLGREPDSEVDARKDRLFREHIVPKIIERLHAEYGI